ncbi:MAG TPA: hypothetical protein VFQ53_29200 [Kofleriaceae bacterium]|nr:hypothetical protein [Kofleriaceae bacterium]
MQELHLRGYQRLRISPGMSPSGMHWRCAIAPVTNILRRHGALIANHAAPAAQYSSSDPNFFEWPDTTHASPSHLAELFIERFPSLLDAGRGSDWLYAGWYVEMLHLTYPDALPIAYADWELPSDQLATVGSERRIRIPMPPPGEG